MKFKQNIVIRQLPREVPMSSSIGYSDTVNSCCCCCSNGIVNIETQCDKTAYFPNETVKIISSIDNSQCTKNIKSVKVQLRQHIYLFCKKRAFEVLNSDHTFNHEQVLLEQNYPGLKKGEKTNKKNKFMELDLRKYRSKEEATSFPSLYEENDDRYLAEGIQPTVTGTHVKITYSLRILPEYGSCCVCSPPSTCISLFISPPQLPSYQKIQAPQNWDPQVFDIKEMAAPVPKTDMSYSDSAKGILPKKV